MKTRFLILFALVMIPIATESFADESECDINDEQVIRTVLNSDHVVQKFLELHPSAKFVHNPTYDEPGNPWTTSEFSQNGITLGVIISTYDDKGGCYWIREYSVIYDMPSTGVGISLSRAQTFESDQKNEAIQAIIDTTNPLEQIKNGVPITEIKCREGLVPTFKRDRVTPACVTDATLNELISRGWTPLRLGMPAETNILITYGAQSVHPIRITQEFNSEFPMDNMIFWVNNDVVSHSIVADDNSWSVESIESGRIGAMTFNQTGIYPYHIKENPNAEGRLVFEYPEPEPGPITSFPGLQVDVTGQQQVRRGTTHDIIVNVSRDANPVPDALVRITIEGYGEDVIRDFKGRTDDSGRFVFSWEIPKRFDDIKTLLAYVDVTDDISAKTILFKFQVYCLPGEIGCKVEGK